MSSENRAVAAARSAAGHDPDVLVKVDPATNARFFFNKKTKKSGWHLHEVSANHAVPKENAIGAARSASASSTGAPVRLADLQQGLEHAAKSPKMHHAPDAHIEEHVQSGKRFYYCTKTGRSAWHKGELLATPRHNTTRAGVAAAKSAKREEVDKKKRKQKEKEMKEEEKKEEKEKEEEEKKKTEVGDAATAE